MDGGSSKIAPLNEQNYPTWKTMMKMFLLKEGLFDIVDGSEQEPTGTAAQPAAATEVAKYKARMNRALGSIVMAIEPRLLYILGEPSDPKEVWKTLQDTFQSKSWSNRLRLKKTLYSMKLQPGEEMQRHLKKFVDIFSELAIIGDPLKEEDKVICALSSLPDCYSTLVTALETSPNIPKWTAITEHLLHEEKKISESTRLGSTSAMVHNNFNSASAMVHNRSNGTSAMVHNNFDSASAMVHNRSNGTSAMVYKNKNGQYNRKNKGDYKPKCYECNEFGHLKRNCHQFLNKIKNANTPMGRQSHGSYGNISIANMNRGPHDVNEVILVASGEISLITEQSGNLWVIDSGATQHMCHEFGEFLDYVELDQNIKIQIGDGKYLDAIGKGNINVNFKSNGNRITSCTLKNVLYVPSLRHNLISVSQITAKGNNTLFVDDKCLIVDKNNNVIACATKIGNLYTLDNVKKSESTNISVGSDNTNLWHRRLGHTGDSNLKKVFKSGMVEGKCQTDGIVCEDCENGKSHKLPFPKVNNNHNKYKILELIHSDICGPLNPVSKGQGKYFITFIDECSKYCWVFVLKSKCEAFETFKSWKCLVEAQYERKVKILRSDNGGEYLSNAFSRYLEDENIIHQTSIPRTPEQNGVAERKNRSLVEKMRCMLSDAKLPKMFWGEALSTANHIINRLPTASLNDKTPYELLNKKIPNIKYFKVFGCLAYVHIDKESRGKLDFKAKKCLFLGYSATMKAYRLFDLNENRIINSRNLIFDEFKNYSDLNNKNIQFENQDDLVQSVKYEDFIQPVKYDVKNDDSVQSEKHVDSVQPVKHVNDEITHAGEYEVNIPAEENIVENDQSIATNSCADNSRKSSRVSKAPDRFGEWVNINIDYFEPKSVKEALNSPEHIHWKQAMENEILAMKGNDVWDLCELPQNAKTIDSKWVFRKKVDASGHAKYKARLVAKGFTQEYGIDYFDVSSPVARFESVRTTLAFGAQNGMEFHHMDVTSAFLNGKLTENIYMTQPEGYTSEKGSNLVCHLKKAIYGLKQASKCWNDTFNEHLVRLGFQQSANDPCLYTYMKNGVICFIILYVDDVLIGCQSKSFISKIKSDLSREYLMKDLGRASEFLGINIIQNSKGIFIHQSNFIECVLSKYNFDKCNPVKTPAEVGMKLQVTQDDEQTFDKEVYQSVVGVLLFISTRCRPDIAFAVCNAARYVSNPSILHWNAIKRVLRYLRGTSNFGIFYQNENCAAECVGYSDADWGGSVSDRKSTSGFCFSIGQGLISWRSAKQSCVALSTAEAELVSLSSAAQEAAWIGKILKDLGKIGNEPIKILEDNNSTICLVKSFKTHSKLKHIDIKYNYVKEAVKENKVSVSYCATELNLADIFTKALPSVRFTTLRKLMGVTEL